MYFSSPPVLCHRLLGVNMVRQFGAGDSEVFLLALGSQLLQIPPVCRIWHLISHSLWRLLLADGLWVFLQSGFTVSLQKQTAACEGSAAANQTQAALEVEEPLFQSAADLLLDECWCSPWWTEAQNSKISTNTWEKQGSWCAFPSLNSFSWTWGKQQVTCLFPHF